MSTWRIDVHTHLTGIGTNGSGCSVSSRMRRTLSFHAVLHLSGAGRRAARGREDDIYVQHLASQVNTAAELDFACVFALDGVYDEQGRLDPRHSHMVVPNAYVFDVCRRHPKLLPVISVNPDRSDAVSELEKWGQEAIALKWLAPLQKFEFDAERHAVVLDVIARLGLPVIVHSGCEHTFPDMVQRLGNPALYKPLLERGIPVIFSHCGTGSFVYPGHDYSREFIRLLDSYPHAYGDTSAFSSLVRSHQVRRFSEDRYRGRLLHGSDFPIPVGAWYFWRELGWKQVLELQGVKNPLDRDVQIKRAVGMPPETFTAAGKLLERRIAHWLERR